MPRRRMSPRVSISSDHSVHSEQSDSITDLPDPGLPQKKSKDAKGKRERETVEVKTKSGKITASDVVDLTDALASLVLEKTPQMMRTKGELRQVMTKYYGNDKTIRNEINKLVCQTKKDAKHQIKPGDRHQRKTADGDHQRNLVDENRQWKPADKEHEWELVEATHETTSAEENNEIKPVEEKNKIKPVEKKNGRKLAAEKHRKPAIESRAIKKQALREAREACKREAMRAAKEAKETKKKEMEEKKKELEAKKRELEAKKREIEQKKSEMGAKGAVEKKMDGQKKEITEEVETEKVVRGVVLQNNKFYKPGDCLKYITMEMHPLLAAEGFMAEAAREVRALGAGVVATDSICDEGLIFWIRHAPKALNVDTHEVPLGVMKQQCPRALFVQPAEALAARALAVGAKTAPSGQCSLQALCARDILNMRALASAPLTYILFGSASYSSQLPSGEGVMTRERFRQLIFDLRLELVTHGIDLVAAESPGELAGLVAHCTRAVADAPHKRMQSIIDEHADFYMRGDNKNCVTVDKDGNGLSRLWEQMLAVLPQSSLDVARSLGAEYKNPCALLQEFETRNGEAKIADLGVARTNVPGAKARRLGPEFTRKLHKLFTAEDGDIVIE